jgi:hypothetical protein
LRISENAAQPEDAGCEQAPAARAQKQCVDRVGVNGETAAAIACGDGESANRCPVPESDREIVVVQRRRVAGSSAAPNTR